MTKNSKVSLNQKFDRTIQNSKFDFSKNFKFFAIASFVIILVGILMFSFLGFNLSSDFATLHTTKIYTNAENYITDSSINSYDIDNKKDYNKVVSIVKDILNKNNACLKNVEKTTIDLLDKEIKAAEALQITFYSNDVLTDEQLNEFNDNIKIELSKAFGYTNQDNVAIVENAITDVEVISPYSQANTIIYSAVIALIVSLVFMLVYLSLRYEKSAFVTGFITILHDLLLTLSIITICRIPLSLAVSGTIGFVFILSIINLLMYYSKSKELTASGAVDKFKSGLVANETSKANIKFNLYLYVTLIVLSIILIAISTTQIKFLALNILLATFACYYSAQFVLNGFYRMVYKPIKKNRKFI